MLGKLIKRRSARLAGLLQVLVCSGSPCMAELALDVSQGHIGGAQQAECQIVAQSAGVNLYVEALAPSGNDLRDAAHASGDQDIPAAGLRLFYERFDNRLEGGVDGDAVLSRFAIEGDHLSVDAFCGQVGDLTCSATGQQDEQDHVSVPLAHGGVDQHAALVYQGFASNPLDKLQGVVELQASLESRDLLQSRELLVRGLNVVGPPRQLEDLGKVGQVLLQERVGAPLGLDGFSDEPQDLVLAECRQRHLSVPEAQEVPSETSVALGGSLFGSTGTCGRKPQLQTISQGPDLGGGGAGLEGDGVVILGGCALRGAQGPAVGVAVAHDARAELPSAVSPLNGLDSTVSNFGLSIFPGHVVACGESCPTVCPTAAISQARNNLEGPPKGSAMRKKVERPNGLEPSTFSLGS